MRSPFQARATKPASLLVALASALAMASPAWPATYTLHGFTLEFGAGIYHNAKEITGSFTTAVPVPANWGTGTKGPLPINVTSWSLSDGVFTYTNANSAFWPDSRSSSFAVTTDDNGAITAWVIVVTRPGSGAALGAPAGVLYLGPTEMGFGEIGAIAGTCFVLQSTGDACNAVGSNLSDIAYSLDTPYPPPYISLASGGPGSEPPPPAADSSPPLVTAIVQWDSKTEVVFNASRADAGKQFTASCTPVGGGATLAGSGSASPVVVLGTRAGTPYACSVTAR